MPTETVKRAVRAGPGVSIVLASAVADISSLSTSSPRPLINHFGARTGRTFQ